MTTSLDIKRIVAHHYGITVDDLCGPSRKRDYAHPRQVAYWMMQKHAGLSTTQIGRQFGGRDHTTVMFGISRAKARAMLKDGDVKAMTIEQAILMPDFSSSRFETPVFRSTRGK
ncbi:MAG: putative bacterial DnaA helix-turn-helix protein [Prokaryotic dsDNA virus sp.]|nr:MAG: putative bacterial DnaA helix-turn-helix protein [Prokaryotic dsDNA virus sp.]QDP53182.1 MAG: putative bacterial DnaA helix-turn-helix protein [Prokaryotic dsDNA virus sp.]|tara:strand:+ start:33906 stop:34247 length:342 start_codon:yes stop_codon:yes gene_type:complete